MLAHTTDIGVEKNSIDTEILALKRRSLLAYTSHKLEKFIEFLAKVKYMRIYVFDYPL